MAAGMAHNMARNHIEIAIPNVILVALRLPPETKLCIVLQQKMEGKYYRTEEAVRVCKRVEGLLANLDRLFRNFC